MLVRVVASVAGVLLIAAWVVALRGHLRRQRARDAEWRDARQRLELWTSSARCLSCGAGDGVVERDGDRLWFVCMRCGHRQPRRVNG